MKDVGVHLACRIQMIRLAQSNQTVTEIIACDETSSRRVNKLFQKIIEA
jgi:hypothetical protein